MTFVEAMEAVRANLMSPPERASRGGSTAARRAAWARDVEQDCLGVVIWQSETSQAPILFLNDFASSDTEEWGLDINAAPYVPSLEDRHATDWQLYELWT